MKRKASRDMLKVKPTNHIVVFISISTAACNGCMGIEQLNIWYWQLPPPMVA